MLKQLLAIPALGDISYLDVEYARLTESALFHLRRITLVGELPAADCL